MIKHAMTPATSRIISASATTRLERQYFETLDCSRQASLLYETVESQRLSTQRWKRKERGLTWRMQGAQGGATFSKHRLSEWRRLAENDITESPLAPSMFVDGNRDLERDRMLHERPRQRFFKRSVDRSEQASETTTKAASPRASTKHMKEERRTRKATNRKHTTHSRRCFAYGSVGHWE